MAGALIALVPLAATWLTGCADEKEEIKAR